MNMRTRKALGCFVLLAYMAVYGSARRHGRGGDRADHTRLGAAPVLRGRWGSSGIFPLKPLFTWMNRGPLRKTAPERGSEAAGHRAPATLVVEQDGEDYASRDANHQDLAAIVANVVVAARRLTQTLTAPIDLAKVRAMVLRQPIAAAPLLPGWAIIAPLHLPVGRFAVMETAAEVKAIVAGADSSAGLDADPCVLRASLGARRARYAARDIAARLRAGRRGHAEEEPQSQPTRRALLLRNACSWCCSLIDAQTCSSRCENKQNE